MIKTQSFTNAHQSRDRCRNATDIAEFREIGIRKMQILKNDNSVVGLLVVISDKAVTFLILHMQLEFLLLKVMNQTMHYHSQASAIKGILIHYIMIFL